MPEEELINKVFDAIEIASNTGKIKEGVNETTKAIERSKAKLVVIAGDVSPEEIIMHLPVLCKEKDTPFIKVPKKKDLGEATGINVPTSSIAITDAGDAKDEIKDIGKKAKELEG